MTQIIIDYEEYLKLLEYKKQIEDIQNGLNGICWVNEDSWNKIAEIKPDNDTLRKLVEDKYGKDKFYFADKLKLVLYRQ